MKYRAPLIKGLLTFNFSLGILSTSAPAAWVTSSDGVYKLSSYAAPSIETSNSDSSSASSSTSKRSHSRFIPRTSGSTWTVQVDDTSSGHKQIVTGFGGKFNLS
jgi:hypothetical protein